MLFPYFSHFDELFVSFYLIAIFDWSFKIVCLFCFDAYNFEKFRLKKKKGYNKFQESQQNKHEILKLLISPVIWSEMKVSVFSPATGSFKHIQL